MFPAIGAAAVTSGLSGSHLAELCNRGPQKPSVWVRLALACYHHFTCWASIQGFVLTLLGLGTHHWTVGLVLELVGPLGRILEGVRTQCTSLP